MGDYYPSTPQEATTTLPFKRTVGIEWETPDGGSLAEWLYEKGSAPSGGLHGYHCTCGDRDHYAIHPTEDCTADGGEYIIGGSKGVVVGSDRFMEATAVLEEGAVKNRCSSNSDVGMHVHVGIEDLDFDQRVLMLRNYIVYEDDITVLAAGQFKNVRSNGNMSSHLRDADINYRYTKKELVEMPLEEASSVVERLPGRPTLNFHGCGGTTCEFRVFNQSKTQWRMYLDAAVAAALAESAAQGKEANPKADMPIDKFLGEFLTADLLVLLQRQKDFWKKCTAHV